MSSPKKPTKRKSPQDMLHAVQDRLDATPERLARAKDAGETPSLDAQRTRRFLDPFDTMRANRVLAPANPKLNDVRWLVGESLRRTHHRARLDQLRAAPRPDGIDRLWAPPRPAAGRSRTARPRGGRPAARLGRRVPRCI